MIDNDRIIKVNVEEEMRTAYINYSMSVIVARALPDVRDGLKPVQRRILYGMMELGNTSDKPYKKSARTVGDVLGKYHPHGDSSVYGALVRMAQDWVMRYPLIDGQGNFGSIDGDSPAAMRYTEARLKKIGEEMAEDLYKETVDFRPNYNDEFVEPTVLPTRIPNLLVNGSAGIAVGMATNIPTHNLSEVIDASVAYIDNPDIDTDGLMQYVKAPDFPTGCDIFGLSGVRDAYETGRGRVIMRAVAEIETGATHDKIVVTAIPYNVNKEELIKDIASMVNEKRIEGISNINDESDQSGMRIVIDVKRDANANVILNKLYKMSSLQTSFSVNCIALVHGRPHLLSLKDCIANFVEHRHEVVIRRTQYDLRKAQERAHIIEGLIIASDNIDEVVRIIKAAKSPADARAALMERFSLSEVQATAIVDMRLGQLTGIQQDKLHAEYEELQRKIAYYNEILTNDELCKEVMKGELIEVKEKYGDKRRCRIDYSASEDFNPEDFYADDEMVITISHLGYIKRTPLTEYRSQNRGGVGSKGSDTRDSDFIEYIYTATMHNTMLFFTQRGKCYWLKVYEIPEGNKNSKGRAIQNLLNIEPDDAVNAFVRVKTLADKNFIESHNLIFCTKQGVIKKTSLEQYSRPRTNGIIAISIREDDRVIGVALTDGNSDIILANRNGKAVRFPESAVRAMGRTATGVKGMDIEENDEIIGMIVLPKDNAEHSILVLSEQGYGKRSNPEDYPTVSRGCKGVKTLQVTEKTGALVAVMDVNEENDLMIINKSGITIRTGVDQIPVQGRATQGVRVINLGKKNDCIGSVCKVTREEDTIAENAENAENAETSANEIDINE
ncbi:MAG: DNA gyrase subunit A [Bacteroidaceae bacterium]|nr:DNA gyrase subunit A [Bacteroidaceae bacterium]MBQ6693304.1 DNA gyrase subunit A [Bacteroidaceae bacterium]